MRGRMGSQPSLAAFRPWPYGPPLRGRAPRGEAGLAAAGGPAASAALVRPNGQALAPVGGLAWPGWLCRVP
jgi:hypothetical protein